MASVWRSCTFSRLLSRKNGLILNNAPDFGRKPHPESFSVFQSSKYSNYAHSPFVWKIKEQYDYEVVKNPPEWSYVARLLPEPAIPKVTPKETYPSGWIPPNDEAKNLPYFISRTKNHVLPIYLSLSNRGARKIALIKKIDGDIWMLNDEIKSYLKNKYNKYIETRVHEFTHQIEVKGDYVNDLIKWAHSKGF